MKQLTSKYAIVGFGIAGQLLALELLKRVPASDITIFDKTLLGGALALEYGSVISNTPWEKTRRALLQYESYSTDAIKEGDSKYQLTECMPVSDIAKYCLMTANYAAKDCEKVATEIYQIQSLGDTIQLHHTFGTCIASTVFICTGAKEKQLNFDIPRIPLSIALDLQQLKRVVDAEKDHVVVFGTAHSGTIIFSNLNVLGVTTTGLYHSAQPFVFSRDGAYDGIKEGSAKIADAILAGEYSNLTLVRLSDLSSVYKNLKKATKIIYAIGFEPNLPSPIQSFYDFQTASIGSSSNIYGYGIAFPGKTTIHEKEHRDVSVLSFQEQIQRTLPAILEKSNP